MARIAGVDLPRHKHIAYSLPYLYGIGRALAQEICKKADIPREQEDRGAHRGRDQAHPRAARDRVPVEGDLRREVQMNIKRLMDLGCYRGLRHRRGLPVNGQRTHTNARTRKGPRKGILSRGGPRKPA